MHDYKRYYILYVDDEEMSLKYFQRNFSNDFRILTAASAGEALNLIQERGEEIGVLLTDQRMPGEKGLQLLERARQLRPRMVRMMVTAYADFGVTVDAVNLGNIFRYISKPIQVEDMRNTLKRALEYYLLQRERDELLIQKLSVIQNMIITDRIISLAVLAAGLNQHLRNPLDAVSTFLHQTPAKLRYEDLDLNPLRDPAFWRDFHAQVLAQAQQVNQLLGHLDGVHSADFQPTEAATDSKAVLSKVVQNFQAKLHDQQVSLQLQLPDSLPPLHIHEGRLARLFELLLEDELMNLPQGASIQLSAEVQSLAGAPMQIRFTLRDDGPGLPQDSLRSVFDPFTVSQGNNIKFGLNLLGVFFLAHHFGGTIKASNGQEGGGSYILDLPIVKAQPKDAALSSEEFVTKVLVNDALWEKLLAGL